jgi:hypothetical protein
MANGLILEIIVAKMLGLAVDCEPERARVSKFRWIDDSFPDAILDTA